MGKMSLRRMQYAAAEKGNQLVVITDDWLYELSESNEKTKKTDLTQKQIKILSELVKEYLQ